MVQSCVCSSGTYATLYNIMLCPAEYWATHDGVQQAHQLLERMRLTHVPAEPYIEAATIAAVYQVGLT